MNFSLPLLIIYIRVIPRVDDETFSRNLMEVQLDIARKRGERNAAKKQNLILHPNVAAKRKIQQAEAKKNAKKARRMNN